MKIKSRKVKQIIATTICLSALVTTGSITAFAAPAPPLTKIYVDTINSSQGGKEKISSSQNSTQKDHGGDWLEVITFEQGYKIANFAKFNDESMRLVNYTGVDLNGDRVYDGFYYYWRIDKPFTEGKFTTQSTSTNAPWNTMSTYINIK
jgi:1-aminocyclopropane-1-carboxylate deaminase/D-cysteine desulfhydrase-like pyridoxal-dependent ACC family enzyme